MIRAAKTTDRPHVLALLDAGYRQSRFAALGKIDLKHAEQLVTACIMKHGSKGLDGTLCNVAEADGNVVGMHFGAKARVYGIGDKLSAGDVWYLMKPGHPFDAIALLDAFLKWADADPRVVEISPTVTDAMGEWYRAGALYERRGFIQSGAVYRRGRIAA